MQIREYDNVDLAAKAGALHLLPDNADFYAEQVRISVIVASLPATDGQCPRIADYAWRMWVNSSEPMRNAPEMGGDPPEGPYVVEVACFGGPYLTIPANNPEDPFIVTCLLHATFHILEGDYGSFRNQAANIAVLGLWLSDLCIRGAGLNRNERPQDSDNGDIRWPHDALARKLERAVKFRLEDIATEMSKRGLGPDGLKTLCSKFGDLSRDYRNPLENPICRRPFVITNDELIVISPSTIVPAVRDALLELVLRHGLSGEIATAYRQAVAVQIRECADLQGWSFLGSPDESGDLDELVFQFDNDKVAIAYCICDDLKELPQDSGGDWWKVEKCIPGLQSRIQANEAEYAALDDAPAELLHICIIQGIGRHYMFGLPEPKSGSRLQLQLTGDDFRIFSLLNLNNSLGLWQVASALQRLPKRTGITGGFLDHYALFRSRKGSYYFPDKDTFDHVTFVASGIEARFEAHERLDPHFVCFPETRKYGKVLRLQSKAEFPIYTAQPPDPHCVRLLVEGLKIPIWIVAQSDESAQGSEFEQLYFYVADAIAFWIWQLTPSLRPLIDQAVIDARELVIHVKIQDGDEWLSAVTPTDQSSGITVAGINKSSRRFEFSKPFAARAAVSHNVAERELATLLVTHIAELVGSSLAMEEVETIVNRHAPLGEKRRFMIVTGDIQEIVNNDLLPKYRTVDSFNEQELADLLGSHLRENGIEFGNVTDEQRNKLCRQSVAFFFKELQSIVSTLSSNQLLQTLIGRHESLIAQRRLLELQMATHLACFGRNDENIGELRDDIVAIDKASIASRFVIEYVGTCSTNGQAELSIAAYDRLLALAAEIAYYGQLSDALQYELSEHDFELLRSGRLALSDPRYDTAMKEFQVAFYHRMANRSQQEFHRALSHEDKPEKPMDLEEVERATAAEFGLPLTRLVELLALISSSPYTSESGVGTCEKAELLKFLSSKCGSEGDSVLLALTLFTLEQRSNFLAPPAPFELVDVYPWRFNRALSYLRRPLLLDVDGENEVYVWGRRSLNHAASYLVRLCSTGQLKNARSREMLKLQGHLAKLAGQQFNERVSDRIAELPRFIARRQIKKFSGKRIQRPNGEDLGDVDALAAASDSRMIFAIEAKSFAFAKTPVELVNERTELFGELDGKSGAVGRHLERVQWLRDNLGAVLSELGISDPDISAWQVVPLMVLDSDLISPRMVDLPFRILTLSDLVDFLVAA